MPALRVLICPDKFKGTLSAPAAARAMARGWHRGRPRDRLELLPMTDGGDGFGDVVSVLLGARPRKTWAFDAAHRRCPGVWWWEPRTRTAVVESANVIGLAMLPPGRFHPFALDTGGVGGVLAEAAAAGARRCLVGIGGSATNDGGFGLARAMGWKFLDQKGRPIEQWTGLDKLARLRPPRRRRWFADLTVAVDVQNRLLGRRGATRVYGPQKGLRNEEFAQAERCLRRLARVVGEQIRPGLAQTPGAGAAGGLGFGFLAFLDARLEPGFELFARLSALDVYLNQKDLVLTGEGRLDASSLMGKGVGCLARRCRQRKLPCIGLAGLVPADDKTRRAFLHVRALSELASIQETMARPGWWLERLAERVARDLGAMSLEWRLSSGPLRSSEPAARASRP